MTRFRNKEPPSIVEGDELWSSEAAGNEPRDLEAFGRACHARNRIARREQRFTRIVSGLSAVGLIVLLLVRRQLDREGFTLVVVGLTLLAVYPFIMQFWLAQQLRDASRGGDWRTCSVFLGLSPAADRVSV